VPSFTNVQPSQQTPGSINNSTSRNNIGKRQSKSEQETEIETTGQYTWKTIKKKRK
jgi:hypothetical protein